MSSPSGASIGKTKGSGGPKRAGKSSSKSAINDRRLTNAVIPTFPTSTGEGIFIIGMCGIQYICSLAFI